MLCNNSATFKRDLTGLIPERLCRDKKKYEEAFKVFSSFFFLFFCVTLYAWNTGFKASLLDSTDSTKGSTQTGLLRSRLT